MDKAIISFYVTFSFGHVLVMQDLLQLILWALESSVYSTQTLPRSISPILSGFIQLLL